MDATIEVLTVSGLDQFLNLFASVLRTEFPGYTPKVVKFFLEKIYTKNAFYYWLTNTLKTVFVAKSQEELVGFAVIDEPYGGVSFCRWLGILAHYQKKGIGTKLVNEWFKLADTQKCHKVEVAGQLVAKAFYEKMKLDLEGARKSSYFGIDQYLFGKVLRNPIEEVMIK